MLKLFPDYSQTSLISDYSKTKRLLPFSGDSQTTPYSNYSQTTQYFKIILRLLPDYSHFQMTIRLLSGYFKTNFKPFLFSDYSQTTPYSKIILRLLSDYSLFLWTNSILKLILDYSLSQIIPRWLPSLLAYCLFSDYSQTTPIFRWHPDYSLFSDLPDGSHHSQLTAYSQITTRLLLD